MKTGVLILVASGLLAGGCHSSSLLDLRTVPERAAYGSDPIPVNHVEIKHADPAGPGGPLVIEEITGTWKFTTPATVTQVEKRTGSYDQFSLYEGRPESTDRPFVVITVSKDATSLAATDSKTYKTSNHRQYVMNGGLVEEWSGLTDAGAGFCELVVRRPAAGPNADVCHAMAIARNPAQQQMSLAILGSIQWQANR